VHATEAPPEAIELPAGVIKPFSWCTRQIPSSGSGSLAMTVLDKSIVDVMRKYGIVGCGICVVRGSIIGYAKGFGYAQLPGSRFLSTTASRCGSLAKPITGLCALVLADQGKLDLDAEVLPILKDAGIVPRPVGDARVDDRISRIAVRNLMDHTSGLPGGTTYTAWRPGRGVADLHGLDRVPTAADVVSDALGNARLDFDPGTKFQYANANFAILARVIEAKSRMRFGKFLAQVAMPKFGLKPDDIYVSLNQIGPNSPHRGKNEATYYQTSDERFPSFVPSERDKGRVYGEAYRGYTTEASDGGAASPAQRSQ
jgi:CubicO group peptidase (beta-lactamase class C family)